MRFADRPDYEMLRQLFLHELEVNGFKNDGVFDWMEGGNGSNYAMDEE